MMDSGIIAMAVWSAGSAGILFFVKRWMSENDKAIKQTANNTNMIALHKQEMDNRVRFLETLVEKDIHNLRETIGGLAVSVKDLEVRIDRKDESLIMELKGIIKDFKR